MKVKDIRTGSIRDVNDSYGARLIEQGRATLHKESAPAKGKAARKAADT